ncbi:MAG TPA: hypothetical protein VIL48_16910 [Acidimicrobiales bacterium]
MWRRRSRARELVAECEAVLGGRYAAHLGERGRLVPVWAWTNALAHGDEADLRRLVRDHRDHRDRDPIARAPGRWADACAYVAGEVLDCAERYGPLAEVQAAVLVPLELDPHGPADPWLPRPWVRAVIAALDDHRRARRPARNGRARRPTRHPHPYPHPRPTPPPPC